MDCRITFKPSGSRDVECAAVRFSRTTTVFEVVEPGLDLRASAILPGFRVLLDTQVAYQGRAVVSGLVNTGTTLVCEVTLDEPGIQWTAPPPAPPVPLAEQAQGWLADHDAAQRVRPDFKLAVLDLMTFLGDLRLWTDALELREQPAGQPSGTETSLADAQVLTLAGPLIARINQMHERFEDLAANLTPQERPTHRTLTRRLLQDYFLCAPFALRSNRKPLGYAGDYEMMNMLHRRQPEGRSGFARLLHLWLVDQWPARSVRHRVAHLQQHLLQETSRLRIQHQNPRVLSLGCGPAREIESFVRQSPLADGVHLTLIDFDVETLDFASRAVSQAARETGRRPHVDLERMSAQQLLRTRVADPNRPATRPYDFIYCAGLFDYLSDVTCRQLVEVFFTWLAPGGLVVVSNMDATRPFRGMLEFLLDWHLIYRNAEALARFIPRDAPADACRLVADPTGVNLFLEIRKPESGRTGPTLITA